MMTVRRRGRLFFVGIWLAAFAGAFESVGLGPSYPIIAEEMTGGTDVGPYITSFTAFSFASAVGLAGFLRAGNFGRWFTAATTVQICGLALCALATSQPLFILGRCAQGFGEGLITVAIFYAFVQFLDDPASKARGIASVSVAWLSASAASPMIYGSLSDDAWRSIFWALVATTALSGGLVILGRPDTADDDTSMWPELGQPQARGWIILGFVTIVVFLYSQGASRLQGSLVVVTVGALILVGSAGLLLTGQLGLKVTKSRLMLETLITRGMISSVYAVTMAFLPLTLYAKLDSSPVDVALVSAVAAVGWTSGSLLQTKLIHFRGSSQLSIGLFGVCLGVSSIGLNVFMQAPWVLVALGAFIAGAGTGITTNSLPTFISGLSTTDKIATDLSAAESVDTITTTIAIAAVGVVLSPILGSPGGSASTFWFFAGAAVLAGLTALYVLIRGVSMSKNGVDN